MLGRPASMLIDGPAGALEVVCELPVPSSAAHAVPMRGWSVLAHPHPLMGGTMDNKVVHTLARACLSCGFAAIRLNFRGVGQSAGQWDEGRGEVDDMLAVLQYFENDARWAGLPLVLGGFSFGGYVAATCAQRVFDLTQTGSPTHSHTATTGLMLVSPAVSRFDTPAVALPTQIIQGDADDVVSLQDVSAWAALNGLPVSVVPGAGHFFHGQLGELKDLAVRYLESLTT